MRGYKRITGQQIKFNLCVCYLLIKPVKPLFCGLGKKRERKAKHIEIN